MLAFWPWQTQVPTRMVRLFCSRWSSYLTTLYRFPVLPHIRTHSVSTVFSYPYTQLPNLPLTFSYLDGKHTIFGRVSSGMRVVQRLGSVATDTQDRYVCYFGQCCKHTHYTTNRPKEDVKIHKARVTV